MSRAMTSRESHWERDNHVRIKRMKFEHLHVSINHIKFRELWNFPFSESRIFSKFRKFLKIFDTHWKYRKLAWKILLIILPKILRIFIFWHFDNFVKFTIVPVLSLCLNFYEFSWIKTAWHESGLSKSGIINRPTDQKFNSLTTIKMQFEKCQKRQFLVSKSQKLASHR